MYRIDIPIELQMEAPFITQSSSPGDYGIDYVVARNADGTMIIPETLIIGKLRQSWEELESAIANENDPSCFVPTKDEIRLLLGSQLQDGEYAPKNKRLFFSDFILTNSETQSASGQRIRIDPARGAVDQGALFSIEKPFCSGALLVFTGFLRFEIDSENKAEKIYNQVKCGLQWTSQIGGLRTIGYGRLKAVNMGELSVKKIEIINRPWGDADGFDLVIIPDGPFCIAMKPRTDNIFESSEEIPGGVVLGCMARSLNRLAGEPDQNEIKEPLLTTEKEIPQESDQPGATQEKKATGIIPFFHLRKNFSKLRITHAFPGANCFLRPVKPPLSLVKSSGLYDVALLDQPGLINNEPPEFSVDWKDDSDVRKLFGWPYLRRELRVRTAIDSKKLRSRENELFAYEMIVPDNRCWFSRVFVDQIEERERNAVLNELACFFEQVGILGLGKSKTVARAIVMPAGTIGNIHPTGRASQYLGIDGYLVITLQTPALLLDPKPLAENNDYGVLNANYKQAWQELCPEMELVRYFAAQSLSGGLYQYERFKNNKELAYQPWLLTNAGSVFIFRVKNEDSVGKQVEKWLKNGLDLPDSVVGAYSLEGENTKFWKRCPFIPQNGYGEIAANLSVHEDRCPPMEAYEIINAIEGKKEEVLG